MDKLLSFSPMTRMVVEEALAHPYLEEYSDPQDEPVAEKPFQAEVTVEIYLYDNTLQEETYTLVNIITRQGVNIKYQKHV